MCGTGCHRRASSPVTGLYVNTVGDHPSLLVVLPDHRYVHCVYRNRLHRYISQAGRWSWCILKGHRRRLSFDGFVFYPGDRTGYPPGIDSGQPGYWLVHVGRDGNGRARLCLDVDGYDRYFVRRLPAGWVGPLVKELGRHPMAESAGSSERRGAAATPSARSFHEPPALMRYGSHASLATKARPVSSDDPPLGPKRRGQ